MPRHTIAQTEKAHAYQIHSDRKALSETRARSLRLPWMGSASAMIAVLRRGTLYGSTWPAAITAYLVISLVVAAKMARAEPDAFLQMNAGLLLLWTSTTAVAGACLGQWYVHRRFREADFVRHNEVGGFIVAIVGSLY